METGTAEAGAGEIATGWLDVMDLPTGGTERLPVIVANGPEDGPVLWVTASIHGDEVTALAAAQDVAAVLDVDTLAGAVVVLPNLSPAGLRRASRTTYYHDDDPNRYFPDPDASSTRPPRVQEVIDERIYDAITDSADAYLDLHTAQVGSVPFVIRDRVLYGERRDEDEAEALAADLDSYAAAFGLPVITEYAPEEYVEQNLQRSTAGAVLNNAGILSLTVELGTHSVVDEDMRALGVAGCFRILSHLGIIEDVPDAVAQLPVESPVDFPVKRHVGPHTDAAGIARHALDPGDVFADGADLADIVTLHGDPVDTLTADHDGYVIARQEGVAVYENDPLYSLAVRDDGDSIAPRNPEGASTATRDA